MKKEIAKKDIRKAGRIVWIDIAKAVTILAMIAGHCVSFGSPVRNFIFSFHMPIFFILTGFTMREINDLQGFWKGLKKDVRHLLLPAVGIQAVNLLLRIFIQGGGGSFRDCYLCEAIVLGKCGGYKRKSGIGSVMVPVCNVLGEEPVSSDQAHTPSPYTFIVYLLLAVLGKMIPEYHWLPQSFDIAMVAVLFIWTGRLLKQYWEKIEEYLFPITVISFIFWIYWWQNGIYIELGTRSYPQFIICVVEAIMGSLCIFTLAKALEAREWTTKVFSMIGKETLIILGVHHLDAWVGFLWSGRPTWEVILYRTVFDLMAAAIVVVLIRKVKGTADRLNKRVAQKNGK